MGSTTYDEARDPSDATWSGASWYGPSSGEYWIVNPREYADPRKHGPEYQQRARRPLAGAATEGEPATDEHESAAAAGTFRASGTSSSATAAGAGPAAAAGPAASTAGTSPDPSAAGAAWRPSGGTTAAAASNPVGRPGWARRAPDPSLDRAGTRTPPRPGDAVPDRDRDRVESLGAASREWLGSPADDPIRRLGLALLAWPPIGLAAATVIGDLTGCSGYSAACDGSDPLLPWLAQAAILGLLLLLPPVARLLSGGAIAVIIALIPITLFLLAIGGGGASQAAPVMATLLVGAWLAGVAWSARAFVRRGAGAVA